MHEPPPNDHERRQPQVRFRLPAASGEPNEIQHIAEGIVLPHGRLKDRKQECELERSPIECARVIFFLPDAVGLAHLIQHGAIRHLECFIHLGVRFE